MKLAGLPYSCQIMVSFKNVNNYYLHHSTLLIHFVCNNSVNFAPWTSTTPWERPFFNSCMKMLWFFLANKLPCNFLWKFKAPIFLKLLFACMWNKLTVPFDYNLCNLLLLKQKTAAFGVRFTCLIQAFFSTAIFGLPERQRSCF